LKDGASSAVINMSHDIHTMTLNEADIARMLSGDEGADISSNKSGVANERIQISDFSDGDEAGKVEK
ncbi:MAG: hypothetical protein K6C05_03325, partial [Anaerovibrio sp.]|uniref:hypothetical protein n=1 Tax=Anaerovibrio sp. TaxID=1872532 RepID=UPI0025D25430